MPPKTFRRAGRTMGWETRRGRRYYFDRVRDEYGNPRKVYLGAGDGAQAEAQRAVAAREAKAAARAVDIQLLELAREAASLLDGLEALEQCFFAAPARPTGGPPPQEPRP